MLFGNSNSDVVKSIGSGKYHTELAVGNRAIVDIFQHVRLSVLEPY